MESFSRRPATGEPFTVILTGFKDGRVTIQVVALSDLAVTEVFGDSSTRLH